MTALLLLLAVAVLLTGTVTAVVTTATVEVIGENGETVLSKTLPLDDLSFELTPYINAENTDISDTTPSALHAVIALLEDGGYDPTDPEVFVAVDSDYGIYLQSMLGSEDPAYWTFQVDGVDAMVGAFDHKVTAGETITFVWTVYEPAPTTEETTAATEAASVTTEVIGEDGESILSSTLNLDDLSFDLAPYVDAENTDISDTTPSALHAVIALLEDGGYDPTDPEVFVAVDSDYGIYLASILGSADPAYWTFQVDGADSMVGVFDHKLTEGESITFVWTVYEPAPTTEPTETEEPTGSGLPLQDVDVASALETISGNLSGTSSDWEMLALIQNGQSEDVDEAAWLDAAYTRLTDPEQSLTDLERVVLVLTALGRDARTVAVDGTERDLVAEITGASDIDTYGLIFGLAALDSAGYPYTGRTDLVSALLDARLADGGWSWAPTEAASDTDTTAMAISVLAGYMDRDDVAAAVDAALTLLAERQEADGTFGSSNTTAMVLVALNTLGRDGQTDALFVQDGGDVLSGLFRYQTEEGTFGYLDTEHDDYATEQAFRALVGWQQMSDTGEAQSPYVFASAPDDLETGTTFPAGAETDDGGSTVGYWLAGGAMAILTAVVVVFAIRRGKKATEA